MKKYICIGLAICMMHSPRVVLAKNGEMIPTASVVEQLSRAEAESKIQEIVSAEEVRTKLATYGINPQDVSGRLASLSDTELRQLSTQMQEARYGGDTLVGVLVVVALVLVILFLARRI